MLVTSIQLQVIPYSLSDPAVIPNRSIHTLYISKVGFLLLWSWDISGSSSSGGSRVTGRGIGGSSSRGYKGRCGTIYTVSSKIL